MSDMLIRNMSPRMKRQIKERARAHGRSMSEEVKALLEEKLRTQTRNATSEPSYPTWFLRNTEVTTWFSRF